MKVLWLCSWHCSRQRIVGRALLRSGGWKPLQRRITKRRYSPQRENAPVPKNRGMKFGYRDSTLTLLLGFWCTTITLLLFRTFSIAPWLGFEWVIVGDGGLWIGYCIRSGGWKSLQRLNRDLYYIFAVIFRQCVL